MQARRSKGWYVFLALLLLVVAGLIGARIYLGIWLPQYVNQVLNNIPGYVGGMDSLDIDLWRGAYRIHKLHIEKKSGNIPVPFVAIETTDLQIEWESLMHGRIVSQVKLEKPVINFAISPSGNTTQDGAGVDWTKPIKDLEPTDINYVKFSDGTLTYRDFSTHPKVDLFIHRMSGEVDNLRNVVDKSHPLPSTIIIKGDSIGGGKLDVDGRINILKEVPDMALNVKLEGVDLKALTDYTNAYASVDISKGRLDLYAEVNVKDSRVSGYVKPLATDIELIDLKKDANPVKVVWESVVGFVVKIFTNLPRDQFATKIPLEGNLNDVHTSIWPTIGGIIRNAFFQAFKKGFDNRHDVTPDTAPKAAQ